jgi:hypothetical protein
MLAASVLPGTGRRLHFQIGYDRCERGFPVLLGRAVVGHIRHFREELVDAMTVVEALLSSLAGFAKAARGDGRDGGRAAGWMGKGVIRRVGG